MWNTLFLLSEPNISVKGSCILWSQIALALKWLCHETFHRFFLLKRFDLGPTSIWTGENGFANFFVFAKIFDRKGVRVVVDFADTCQRIVVDHAVIVFWNDSDPSVLYFYIKSAILWKYAVSLFIAAISSGSKNGNAGSGNSNTSYCEDFNAGWKM